MVVPGALAQIAVLAALDPGRAVVIGAVDRALLVLDHRPDSPRLRAGGCQPDLAVDALLRQARVAADVLPGVAAVEGAEDLAALAARRHVVRTAARLPGTGVEDARVRRVHRDLVNPGIFADEEDALPGLAAVGRAVQPAVRIGTEDVAERRDVDDVRVRGVDRDLADVAGRLQAHVLPALSGIGGLVDAVAARDVAADRRLAHPDIDHVRVRRRDLQRADRGVLEVAVGDVVPARAGVVRFPDAAAGRAEVVDIPILSHPTHGDHAAASMRADQPVLHRLELLRIDRHRFPVPRIPHARRIARPADQPAGADAASDAACPAA